MKTSLSLVTVPDHARRAFGLIVPLVILLCTVLGSQRASGSNGEVTLEWDANVEPEVEGYRLHIGRLSGTYDQTIEAGAQTSAAVSQLTAGVTYYFVVTAYNTAGLESLPSNEVSFEVPWPQNLQIVNFSPGQGESGPMPECRPLPAVNDRSFGLQIFAINWPSVTVYASSNLNTWEIIGTIPNPNGGLTVRDLESLSRPSRFYRVRNAVTGPP